MLGGAQLVLYSDAEFTFMSAHLAGISKSLNLLLMGWQKEHNYVAVLKSDSYN